MEYIYDPQDLAEVLPPRRPGSNKGTFGKVLVIAGSRGMCGAAYLCGKAAYRAGAGLVYVLTEECNRTILQQLLPEAVLYTYEPESLGESSLQGLFEGKSAVVLGPGLGKSGAALTLLKAVLTLEGVPRILDADALNLLSEHGELWETAAVPFIVTPHVGEMARLCKKEIRDVKADLSGTASAYAREHGIVAVLKDAQTVVSDGRDCSRNLRGNHGMATGGSGDVLSGVIGGLLAQGLPLFEAARAGVYLHALAGDEARRERGAYSMMAGDILEHILWVPGL